ncbi:MAG TPA: efflux RND transporter periplasmic adaptor subunit [Lacibacter sp.]|nr:efflux RND transporter periplasmic adaptor subunit [Lacibacter sp.]
MRTLFTYTGLLLVLLAASCTESRKEKNAALADKKTQLEKLQKQQVDLASKILQLEKAIAEQDTSFNKEAAAKLIAVAPVGVEDFAHYIDLQGRIESDQISYVAPPNGQGGVVTDIAVKEGQYVQKGQLLLKLDDKVLRQQIRITETQLALARELYQRTQNLWEQQIGSEVQLLQARSQGEALERSMATASEQIKLYTVYAPVSGIADVVNVKVGELFVGANQAGPQIRIVNNASLKAQVDVPENYAGRVKEGSQVVVHLPDLNKTFLSAVKRSSQLINPSTRTFTIEATIPGGSVRPNSIAAVRIRDYSAPNAMVIPVNLVQTDDKGKYVYAVEKDSRGRLVAVKKAVVLGESYNDKVEIKAGLQPGMQLISEGYQSVYDNQLVRTE